MKYALIIIILISCKSELTLQTTKCYTNDIDTIKVKARKSICLVTFEGDSVWKLVDYKNRILKDSVCDYRVLKVKK